MGLRASKKLNVAFSFQFSRDPFNGGTQSFDEEVHVFTREREGW